MRNLQERRWISGSGGQKAKPGYPPLTRGQLAAVSSEQSLSFNLSKERVEISKQRCNSGRRDFCQNCKNGTSQRAEEHPEIIPNLKKMMDYYLPMTVKLLDAYEDMDRQSIQGETICASKKEIEDTLDTLNEAFAKLLESVFQDTAWDMSSDIFVVNTILAQEGLTGNDFIHK